MSKKQQTLLQSWGTKSSQQSVPKNKQSNEILVGSDEDDLLRQALEESLKDFQSNQPKSSPCNTRNGQSSMSSSSSGYSTEVPTATLEENLPGFDNTAGNSWIYPTNKPIRKYQRDIVETSLFYNTLVTLPTGLGKTFIAAVVMYNFFRWYPRGKIIFMAPTKPLVAQQIQACYEIMGIPLDATSEMTGAMDPNERKKQWKEKRVFFLTPQILTNDISRAALLSTEVKCLVLDEAHKALGNYAYVQVVKELCNHGAVFRILALSATPGKDMKAIQQVIVNLRISRIELRNEESPDIVPYVHNRNIEKTVVPLGPEISQVRDTFLNILGTCARRLITSNVLYTKDIGSLTKFMVIQSRDKFRQNPPDNFPQNRRGMTEGDFATCITLTHALELLMQHGIRGFYNFLAGKTDLTEGEGAGQSRIRTELYKVNGFSQMMEDLKSKFGVDCQVGSSVSHPKLNKLREIVLEHFQRAQSEGRETRVMIFSQYRDSVNEIVALLEEYGAPLIKAMSFVGHGSGAGSVKTKGFTQADQIRVIKQFSEGNYNTLVSTCVGEEGLDIGDVDMIICYDVHKSPVRLVQRCGRTGRKRDGRIVMLMTEGKEEHVFNQSMAQKKNLLKNIVGNPKLKDYLLAQEPRLIPRHLKPRCHEMPMQVTVAFPVPTSRPSARASLQPGVSAPRKSKTTKCYYLSDTEIDYWARSLQTNQLVPVVPDSKGFGTRYDMMDDKLTLNLDKWLPWQASLQQCHMVGHSTLTKNYVNIVEHIQSQQEDWYNYNYQQTTADVREVDGNGGSPPRASFLDIEQDSFVPGDVKDKSTRDSDLPHSIMSHTGLFSPDFLDIFNSVVSIRIESPNIPNPPSFCFTVSSNGSPSPSPSPGSFRQPVSRTWKPSPSMCQPSFECNELSPDQPQGKAGQTNTPISEITTVRMPRKSLFTTSPAIAGSSNAPPVVAVGASKDNSPQGIDWNRNETSVIQTPPKSEAEASTFFLEPSPILSQRRKKGPVKRSLEWATSTPAPAKRLRMDASANNPVSHRDEQITTNMNSKGEQDRPSSSDQDPFADADMEIEQSLLSVTQFINLLDQADARNQREDVPKRLENIKPNFELEVDFLDSSQSLPGSPKDVKQNHAHVTPVKKIPAQLQESPVFDFMENPSQTPSPIHAKSEFSLRLADVPGALKVANQEKSLVKADFSLGFPDSWDDEDFLPPSPVPPPAKTKSKLPLSTKPVPPPAQQPNPASAFKSAWDDGFELSLNDIEDIELVEKANADQIITKNFTGAAKTEAKQGVSSIIDLSDRKETSSVLREIESIFGPEIDEESSVEVIESVKPEPLPIFTVSSDDDAICDATPLKPVGGRMPVQIFTSDEDSPLICRKLNRKRNLLVTQSTPNAEKKEKAARPAAKDKRLAKPVRKASCSFFDDEAELSLVEGSCSGDEIENTQNQDRYEGSFVDDQVTQAVNESMRAIYLKSVKSPLARQGFLIRQPSKQMTRDEIFSQAVVEQDSDYSFDSFCVDSDEVEENEATRNEPSFTPLPPRAAKLRAKRLQDNKPKIEVPNSRRRKRIVFQDTSSDEEEKGLPPSKKTNTGPTASTLSKNKNLLTTKPEEKNGTFLRPVDAVSASSNSDGAIFLPPSSKTATSSIKSAVVAAASGSSSAKTNNNSTITSSHKVSSVPIISSTIAKINNSALQTCAVQHAGSFTKPNAVVCSNQTASSAIKSSSLTSSSNAGSSSTSNCRNSTSSSPPRTLLISSRQVATTTQVISSLQVKYRCATHVCSFDVADFVLSSQLGVIRKLHSEFTNGSSRCRLQEQVRRLALLYDKPYLIVEADRSASRDPRFSSPVPDASSVIFKPNTPYFLQTLATLAQTELFVLHSESQEHTARLLNELGRQETLKGFSLPKMENLNTKQDLILKFLQRIPEINPAVALIMAYEFKNLREILCSSAESLIQRCKITIGKARNIVTAFRVNHTPTK